MSTLATTNLKNPSSGTNNIELETNGNVTATGTVSATTVTSSGSISDSVSDVRTPRYTQLTGSSDHNLTNEGVYFIDSASTFSQIIIGTGASLTAGTIMTIYNNRATSVTISKGSILLMRVAADGDYTDYSTRTLGRNSVTTITMVGDNNLIILTGTDVS